MADNQSHVAILALAVCHRVIKRRRRQRRQRNRTIWRKNWIENHNSQGAYCNLIRELEEGDEKAFQNFVRMDVTQFNEILAKVTPYIRRETTNMREAIDPGERLAITLRFLATGETFRSLSYLYRTGETTIGKIIPETCQVIYDTLKDEFLKFPSSEHEWEDISEEFWNKWQFPNCIGSLDGKHIQMKAPANSGSAYFNYKHTYSIVLLALVDANYRFIYCDVGCNGRVSDGGVFSGCTLKQNIHDRTAGVPKGKCLPGTSTMCSYHIVADDAFPLIDYIMKPFQQKNLSQEQRVFNYRLSRGRRVVENAFGILANRFRVFLTPIALPPETIEKLVMASCALHNYLIAGPDNRYMPRGFIDSEDPENHVLIPGQWRQEGRLLESTGIPHNPNPAYAPKVKRELLKDFVMSDEGSVSWQMDML